MARPGGTGHGNSPEAKPGLQWGPAAPVFLEGFTKKSPVCTRNKGVVVLLFFFYYYLSNMSGPSKWNFLKITFGGRCWMSLWA